MPAIDGIFLFIIGIPFAYGLYRGIVRMVISTLSLFLGFLFARQYAPSLTGSLEGWVDLGGWGKIVAFLLRFVAVVFLVSMLGRLIRKGVQGANLGWIDRLIGGCLGSILGMAAYFGLSFLLFHFLPEPDRYLKESRLAPGVVESGQYCLLLFRPWGQDEVR